MPRDIQNILMSKKFEVTNMFVRTVSRPGHTHCRSIILLLLDPGLLVTTPHQYLPQNLSRFCIQRVARSSFRPEKMREAFPPSTQATSFPPLTAWMVSLQHGPQHCHSISDLWLL